MTGARVYLHSKISGEVVSFCGPRGTGRCETVSGPSGEFTFQVNGGANLSSLVAVSQGGKDTETGVEFSGIGMRAPLELFVGAEHDLAITPITSLCAGRPGDFRPLEQTSELVRGWLGLGQATPLGARPSDHPELLQRSLLLTKLALERKKALAADPFGELAQGIDFSRLFDEAGTPQEATLVFLGFDDRARRAIGDLHRLLSLAGGEPPAAVFKRAELAGAAAEFVGLMFAEDAAFDAANENFRANAVLLAERILVGTGGVVPLGGLVPERLVRYVLHAYGPQSWSWGDFTADREAFAARLVHRETGQPFGFDPFLFDLVRITAPQVTALPLLQSELPGDDNRKRLEYYYNSDISHLYQAEKLIGTVFDDTVNDAIMLEIAKGKAQAGLLGEARTLIETQIYQSEVRGHAWLAYAEALKDFDRRDEAVSALDEAGLLFDRVIAAKGLVGFGKIDGGNIRSLIKGYRVAGALSRGLDQLFRYAGQLNPAQHSNLIYGQIFSAALGVADALIETGDLAEAGMVVNLMHDLADVTPPSSSDYKTRVYHWVETARRYVDLGDFGTAYTICQKVQAIRSNDGLAANLTGSKTYDYMAEMAMVLYDIGQFGLGHDLIASLPGGASDRIQSEAWKKLASHVALQQGLGLLHVPEPATFAEFSALDILEYRMILDWYNADVLETRIEALTYYNDNLQYLAGKLIGEGRFAEAEQVLDQAVALVAQLDDNQDKKLTLATRQISMGSSKVNYGYAKLAGLYLSLFLESGEEAYRQRAGDLLAEAEAVAQAIVDPVMFSKATAAIAEGYLDLGNDDKTRELLGRDLALEEYQRVARAYLALGDDGEALALLAAYVERASALFGNLTPAEDQNRLAREETDHLLKAADLYIELGAYQQAVTVIDLAGQSAWEILVPSERMLRLQRVVERYAKAEDFEQALALAQALPFTLDRNQAIQAIATVFATLDRFPDSPVANVDTDGDGQPDFFHPLASAADIAASGLTLDPDCDGDGIDDVSDFRPLFAEPSGR
ncbi:hypothetical protein DESUT3_00760 [Desulfuromonas versatilis]|uniref:Tetratricopeptide repeat protein n=1 Tax=Desulfuromonas versatilis TaxID=2802975 RepID=A0ABN6DTE3_9BACT|nr:hypothetical protein DESUT3_00760 [Desulfuromonas versatilis]